ncbi:hypothetical protein BX600DRAFT_103067 [Xylariales sp. PMI_506]|nr:hypothetical protein BX600DRAFT_103067 [Xylariales sp. PMI_506]
MPDLIFDSHQLSDQVSLCEEENINRAPRKKNISIGFFLIYRDWESLHRYRRDKFVFINSVAFIRGGEGDVGSPVTWFTRSFVARTLALGHAWRTNGPQAGATSSLPYQIISPMCQYCMKEDHHSRNTPPLHSRHRKERKNKFFQNGGAKREIFLHWSPLSRERMGYM